MMNKIKSGLLGLAVTAGLLGVGSVSDVSARSNVNVQNYPSNYSEVKAESKTYCIYTPDHLRWVSYMASQGYDFYGYEIRLMRDIDFDDEDFYPIGTYDVHFNGTLNGNGYRIKNMNMKFSNYTGIGFIGYLGCNGVVKDLTINSSCVVEGYTNVGAIAGCNCGGKILNCSSYADVYANGSYVGGIVGYNGVNGRVINCSVWAYADIRSGNGCYEGRFIGQNDGFNPKKCRVIRSRRV